MATAFGGKTSLKAASPQPNDPKMPIVMRCPRLGKVPVDLGCSRASEAGSLAVSLYY